MGYWACLAGEACTLSEFRNLIYLLGTGITATVVFIWLDYRHVRRKRKRWEEYYRIRDEAAGGKTTAKSQPDGRRQAQRATSESRTETISRARDTGTERLRYARRGDRSGTGKERAHIEGDTGQARPVSMVGEDEHD